MQEKDMLRERKTKAKPITEKRWAEVNPENRELVEEFLEESTELSDASLKQYRSALRIFFYWVKENCGNKHLKDLKARDFKRYQNWIYREGGSENTIKFKRYALSSLNGYIMNMYEDEYPEFRNFINKNIKVPSTGKVYNKLPLNPEEYAGLKKYLEDSEQWQKLAYLVFTYDTGCRLGESVQLKKEVIDYDIIEKTVTVTNQDGTREEKTAKFYSSHDIRCKGRGKVGKVRRFKFSEDTMYWLNKWIEERGEDDCEYMFVKKTDDYTRPISEGIINYWCHKTFEPIVGRRINPHLFRSSRATNMVVYEGKDIKSAQSQLGHVSSETTETYVVRDKDEDSALIYVD